MHSDGLTVEGRTGNHPTRSYIELAYANFHGTTRALVTTDELLPIATNTRHYLQEIVSWVTGVMCVAVIKGSLGAGTWSAASILLAFVYNRKGPEVHQGFRQSFLLRKAVCLSW